jgi:hypothetical protein
MTNDNLNYLTLICTDLRYVMNLLLKRKKRATWAALQIIRVHLRSTLYHFGDVGQYPLLDSL